jgi:protein phosphatase
LVVGDKLIVANVGDSRAYLFDPGSASELTQITRDHSALEEAIYRGVPAEEASRSAFRHALTRVMDGGDRAEVDIYPRPDSWIDIPDGGIVLVCSDGLSGFLSEETIKATLSVSQNLEAATESLINQALKGGSTDNISVALLSVRSRASKRRQKKKFSNHSKRPSTAQIIRTVPRSRIAVMLLLSAFLIVSLALLIALVLVVYRT